jgi:hypothetical protein
MGTEIPGLSAFQTIGQFLIRLPYWLFVALLTTLVLLHTGFRWPWHPDAEFLSVASGWPLGSSWDTSIGWLAPAWLGFTGSSEWVAIWVGITLISLAVTVTRARGLLGNVGARIFLLAIAASPIPYRLSGWLGFYDGLLLSGALLVAALGPRTWWIGAVLLSSANPEMGLIGGAAAALVGSGMKARWVTIRGLGVMVASSLLIAAVSVVRFTSSPVGGPGRFELLITNAPRALLLNLSWLPLTVATMFGGAWLLVVLVLLSPRRTSKRLLTCIGLVVLPLCFTLVTLDGSRVAIGTSVLAFLLGTRVWLERNPVTCPGASSGPANETLVAGLAFLALLVPAISILAYSPQADFYPPWEFVAQIRQVLGT